MKSIRSLFTLSILLIFGAATIVAALPQQQQGTVPAEKKRAMNKFDPTDLFPEAKEHGRKERTKRDKKSAPLSILARQASSTGVETASASRKSSRQRRPEAKQSVMSETRLAANAVPAPTPVLIAVAPVPSPSLAAIQTQPAPAATIEQSPSPSVVMGGAAALTTPSQQTLIASGNAPASGSETSPGRQPSNDSMMSLPVLLALLSLVALALIFALVKLMKQFRGSVN